MTNDCNRFPSRPKQTECGTCLPKPFKKLLDKGCVGFSFSSYVRFSGGGYVSFSDANGRVYRTKDAEFTKKAMEIVNRITKFINELGKKNDQDVP